jgi:hemerythrin
VWDPALSVGVESIDRQHREIFRQADGLLRSLWRHDSREEVARVLEFLSRYVVNHFRDEEVLMRRSGYAQETIHRLEHAAFASLARSWAAEFDREGPSVALAIRLNHTLVRWLREHIGRADRDLGRFLSRAGVRPP